MTQRLFHFAAGTHGPWRVRSQATLAGEPLPAAERLEVGPGGSSPASHLWLLRGITSNERYVERSERAALQSVQQGLGRPQATRAALIPIRKTPAWWALTQEERRTIFERQSQHTAIGLQALPAVARRLHHCRDLAEGEPFDFLTWFEFAPEDEPTFDEMLGRLRGSPEWSFVDREIDIRLERAGP